MIVGPKTRQAFYFKGDSALLAQADITAWNNFASGRSATLAQVNNLIVNSRLISGALPLDFFHIQLPEGFATTNANSFDITTLQGLKLYRLRQVTTQTPAL